jgi:hypothetical protein
MLSHNFIQRGLTLSLLAAGIVWSVGCGAGGASLAPTTTTFQYDVSGENQSAAVSDTLPPGSQPSRFVPNYVPSLTGGLQAWPRFPLTVAFVHDGNYSADRQAAITAGFDQWVSATNGLIDYRVVGDPSTSDIVVNCNPTVNLSLTHTEFTGTTVLHATIAMGLAEPFGSTALLPPRSLQAMAAHEFGHALGINGHSTDPHDLMNHVLTDNISITPSDLNTLKTAYPRLF